MLIVRETEYGGGMVAVMFPSMKYATGGGGKNRGNHELSLERSYWYLVVNMLSFPLEWKQCEQEHLDLTSYKLVEGKQK